jgi:hypothetical protein
MKSERAQKNPWYLIFYGYARDFLGESPVNHYRFYQRSILLLLFFAITINILDRQVLSLVAPVLRDRLHLSNTEYGIIVFGFLLGMAVGQGRQTDRESIRRCSSGRVSGCARCRGTREARTSRNAKVDQ